MAVENGAVELNKVLWYLLLFFGSVVVVLMMVIFWGDIKKIILRRIVDSEVENVEYNYEVIEVGESGSRQLVMFGNSKSPYSRFGNYYLPVDVNGYEVNLFLGNGDRNIIFEEAIPQGNYEVRGKPVSEVVDILNKKSESLYLRIVIPVDNKDFLEAYAMRSGCSEVCQQEVELALKYWKRNQELMSFFENNKPMTKKLTVGPVGNIHVQ